MRGKLLKGEKHMNSMRITPAHAGKTECKRCSPRTRADHPRACGENSMTCPGTGGKPGSPPRMRGKQSLLSKKRRGGRITPAHAGKTDGSGDVTFTATDHPRACGENPESGIPQLPNVGSPPRMRGKHCEIISKLIRCRITPAHAGKTTTT